MPDRPLPSKRRIRFQLLRWFRRHGRSFAWRSWTDPYRLLVTEVLLRQTRADSVALMIDEFFEAFPRPAALAAAGQELNVMLRPLGFATQRAGQLSALAQHLISQSRNDLTADLASLPGIGAYSSGMVAAVLRVPGAVAVDTNIARVIQRLYGVKPSHFEPRKSKNIWSLTRALTVGSKSSIQVLWALLDLGSAVCKTKNPECPVCPIRNECCYFSARTRQMTAKTNSEGASLPTLAQAEGEPLAYPC